MELFNSLRRELRERRVHHEQQAMKLLKSGAIEELRFQGGYIQACLDLESKAEQLRDANESPVPTTALAEDR